LELIVRRMPSSSKSKSSSSSKSSKSSSKNRNVDPIVPSISPSALGLMNPEDVNVREGWEDEGATLYGRAAREQVQHRSSGTLSGWEYLKSRSWDEAYVCINKKTAVESDSHDRTYLHVAAAADAPLHIIEKLIQLNPTALRFPDNMGKLPLHYSAEYSTSSYITELIYLNHQPAVTHKDRDGNLPLHCALKLDAPEEIVEKILSFDESAAAVGDKHENLALHVAAEYCSNPETVACVLRALPEATKTANLLGMTPLLCAAANGNDQAVKLLLFTDPDCVDSTDRAGNSALHLAVSCRGREDATGSGVKHLGHVAGTVQQLLLAKPSAALDRDSVGDTPLHRACRTNYCSVELAESVVELLLRSTVGAATAVRARNADGLIPLHYAAQHAVGKVVELLIHADPSTVAETNEQGFRALHLAALSPTSTLDARMVLVEADCKLVNSSQFTSSGEGEFGSNSPNLPPPPTTAATQQRRFSLEGAGKAAVRNNMVHSRRAFELSGEMQLSIGTVHSSELYTDFETSKVTLHELATINRLHMSPQKKPAPQSVRMLKTREIITLEKGSSSEDDEDDYPPPPPRN